MNKEQFLKKLNESDIRSVARLITLIENEDEIAESILKKVWKKTGNSYIIGVTGPPGAGKSTIVDSLAKHLAEGGKSVGILAVDPTKSIFWRCSVRRSIENDWRSVIWNIHSFCSK